MATIDNVEINGNPLGFSNEDEARIELLRTSSDVKLHVLDEQALEDLKDEAISSIADIETGLNKKVDDVKAELETAYGNADSETLEKAKEHTDNRLQALQQTLTTKEEQLKETMEELIEEVDTLGTGIENKIDGKVDVLKNELEPKIEANKVLSETNKTTIETVKQFIDFQIQGTLRLVAILTESSSEIDKETDKDTWLTEKVKEGGKIQDMVSGYFVRCSDEVCYFYVDGTWHKGTSGRQSFLVSKPLEFNGRSIELKLKSGSGLKVDTDGTLTFDLTDTTSFDKFLKNDVDTTISSVYTFQQAVKCEVDAVDDKDLVRLSQVNTLIDTAVKGIQHVSYVGSDAIEIDGTTNAISLKVDANSALKVTTDGLTIDLSNVSGNVDLTPYPKKNESNEITAEWDFKAGLKTDIEATDDKHVVNLKKVNEIVDAKFATVPAQVVYTAGDGITIDTNNSISLKVRADAGLKLDTNGIGLDNDALALVFANYTKKNEVTVIEESWTFNKAITLKEQATNDDHVPTWSQVKTHVATEIANAGAGNTPQPQPIVYTGKAPIKVENTEISLVLKSNGGLKEDNGELTLDLDNVDLSGKVDLTGYTKANQDESITGNWTYTVLPKSDVEATEESQFTNLKTVIAKIKEEIDKVNQTIPQPIKYSGVDAIQVDDTQNQISLKIVTDGGLKQDANGLTIDMDKLDIAGKVDLTDYTKSNESETIEEEWIFNQAPKSLQEANDEKHLVNLKQVQDMIAGIKVTGSEYTGTGAIHIDTNKEISLKVDTNSGLKIDNNMLTIERANNNVDLTPYPTKAGNETISGEWKFTSVPKITTKATENEHIPNFQQVKEEITNSMVNGIPEVDKIVEEAKTEVEKVVTEGKGEITKLSGEQMNALNAIITNGTQLLTSGKEEIEKISKEKLEAINTAFEDQKAGIDEKLHEGDKYFQNLLADSADKLDEYSTKTKEEVKRVVELANERMLLESQARQEEISELAEEKLKEFRKLPNPTEKEKITFKTLSIDSTGEGNIVGFQKIVTDLTGQILRYGDMMVLGGNYNNYRADPTAKRASRLNFPTNDIEFDRWIFNFGSFAAIPKRGQTVNLKTIGYEDKDDVDVDLDYYIFFLGHNGGGQFGTGDREHRRKAVPIKFEDKVKSVMFSDWNQGGDSSRVQSFVLLDNGKLFASGCNDSGQFGLGNTTSYTTFTEIKTDVEEIVGECFSSVTYIKDREGCYWKAGSKGWDFNEDQHAWRKISEKNASKLHHFSDWNGVNRGYATELWYDNDKKMWVGRGNNDYYQRDDTGKTLNKGEIGNYLTLNRIRDDLVEVYNFPLSMYAFSKTTAYSWGRFSTPLSSEWTSGNSATVHETPMPLPGRDFKLIPLRQGVTTSDFKTIIVLYYPDLHRMFFAGNVIGSFGLIDNKAYKTWVEIDLPPKVNPDSDVEIRYFHWNTHYQLAIIMENGLYLAGMNSGADYFSPKSSLFNKQEW